MIYETIPASYFDHTALFEAIAEAAIISTCVEYLAQVAADDLMEQDMTSGVAIMAGQFINWAKNIEVITDHWIHLLSEKAYDLPLSSQPDCDKHRANLDKLGANFRDNLYAKVKKANDDGKPFKDVIIPVYGEWMELLKVVAKNYKIPYETGRSSMMLNGEAEKIFA